MNALQNIFQLMFSSMGNAFLVMFIFFAVLYFLGVFLSQIILKFLIKNRKYQPIFQSKKKGQNLKEISHSLVSIAVFSLQAIPMQWLMSRGIIEIQFSNAWPMIWEIPLLFLWNEIHFYAVHRFLHQPWFMKNVHYVHHQSKEPTLYSIYSFHWFESFLLGTVIFIPLLLHQFYILSILSLPIMSIALNLMGHCNHEKPYNLETNHWGKFTFRHTMHHKWSQGNFGFMLPFLDQFFNTQLPKSKH